MALLVTIFLMLVNFSTSSRKTAPQAENLTALDVWLLAAILSVVFSLAQYAAMLAIRYEKLTLDKKLDDLDLVKKCDKLDRLALLVFLIMFCLFNMVYWFYYLSWETRI